MCAIVGQSGYFSGTMAVKGPFSNRVALVTGASGGIGNAIGRALITDTGMLPEEPRDRVPVGRLGHSGEVADLALAMLRKRRLTNQVILLDGGSTAARVLGPRRRENQVKFLV